MQIYSCLVSKLKSNNESMITNIKNNNYSYENKAFKKLKCSSFMFHQTSMFYNHLPSSLLQRYSK